MQGSLRLLTAILLFACFFPACVRKKSKSADVTESAEQTSQSTQSTPSSDVGLREISAAPTQPVGSAPNVPIPVPPDSPVAGTTTDLAASDVAYEAWFRKHNLDLNDPAMLDADTDNDGVSNGDEFMADTDPRNPKSVPAEVAAASAQAYDRLKLREYNEVRLPVVLEEVKGNTARIKRLDQEDKVETVRAGEVIEGLGLKVQKVQFRRVSSKLESDVDASRVVLEDPATGEKTTLVKNMPARSATSHAILTSADGSDSITVRQGETFEWPKQGGSTFVVMDLRDDQVVLRDETNGRMVTVSK